MLGVSIGVAAVIIIVGIGAGAQSLVLSQVKTIGSDLIAIMPGKSGKNDPPASVMGITITTLTHDDVLALSNPNRLPHAKAVAGYVRGSATVSYRGEQFSPTLNGVTANYLEVEGGEVVAGSFYSEADERSMAKVVVLGDATKTEIFGEDDPIGKFIKIKMRIFK